MPLIFFMIYLFAEVMVSSYVASVIGGVWMFAEIVASAVLGFVMLAGLQRHVTTLAGDLMARRLNESELVASSVVRLIGALLLILPGIVTDTLGLLLQMPFLGRRLLRRFTRPKTDFQPKQKGDPHGEIIDVEVVDSRNSLRKHP